MENSEEFKRFDLATDDASDHYFLQHSHSKSPSGKVHKHIMKEWKILEENLPESIYVRVYETRIDLARAVIMGAKGTPYHDGLFFFDIWLPSDYPNRPPKVHYHSFGWRINPNLYGNGKVCLSLLNTWLGKKSEKWEPYRSTLLQVLLSIQALVLNEMPFYNEPGYSKPGSSGISREARVYNEKVFALTCRTTIYLIRRPPKNFEDFIHSHFRERGHVILSACSQYVNGRVRVGYYGCETSSSRVVVRKELIGWMEPIYPKLVEALKSIGAVLSENEINFTFFEKLEPKKKKPSNKDQRHGIFKKAMAKIKQLLGWKNISETKKD